MQRRILLVALAGALGSMAAGAAWASGAIGNLMQLTVRVTEHMAGMAAIPPHTVQRKICMRTDGFDPEALQDAEQRATRLCRIVHMQKAGSTVTFDQACRANGEDITSHGVFRLGPGPDFTGTTHTAMHAAGHAITVDGDYAGKRVGSCAYVPSKGSH